MKINYYRITS